MTSTASISIADVDLQRNSQHVIFNANLRMIQTTKTVIMKILKRNERLLQRQQQPRDVVMTHPVK